MTHKCITNFESLTNFDKTSVEFLPKTHKERILEKIEDVLLSISTDAEVPGTNVGTIPVRMLTNSMKTAR